MLESDLKDEIKSVRNNKCAFSCVFVSQVYKTKKSFEKPWNVCFIKSIVVGFHLPMYTVFLFSSSIFSSSFNWNMVGEMI